MDENKVLESIKLKLVEMGYNYESLNKSQIKYLIKIENELNRRLLIQKESLENIKNNKIKIASISEKINICRKTIYNNRVLKDYIKYVEIIYENNILTNEILELKN